MPANAISEQAVLEALRRVEEPELHRDIVTLNMVKDITIQEGRVGLTIVLTTPACPLKTEIEKRVQAEVRRIPGVISVEVKWDASVPRGRALGDRGPIPGVRNIIAIASGKGGVGKTTVAVNLAIALERMGARVGLMDGDVYGPNVPLMMGNHDQPHLVADNHIAPLEAYGVKLISMGHLNPGDRPLIWRGPMLHSVVQQFLRNVAWGELDYLVVDLPPGTGDVQLSLIQSVPVSGAVIVTTPSTVALADVRKAVEMFRQVNVEILGIVENMSYFSCPHCGGKIDVFGHGEGERMATQFSVPFLGEVEIDPRIRIGGDTGRPVAAAGEGADGAKSFYLFARQVAARLSVANLTGASQLVQIQME
jgi:ATP-binding protein involved in chromosome partitioning